MRGWAILRKILREKCLLKGQILMKKKINALSRKINFKKNAIVWLYGVEFGRGKSVLS